jgi:enediyne polyketide synthase
VTARRRRTARAAGRALGRPAEVHYGADGRPELAGDRTLTAAHGAGLTLCVLAHGPAGCDLEPVTPREDDDWQRLLGRHHDLAGRIAEACTEPFDVAATRVWAAGECLRKAGRTTDAPIMFASGGPDGWVLLTSGDARIGVLSTTVRGGDTPVVLAVLAEEQK